LRVNSEIGTEWVKEQRKWHLFTEGGKKEEGSLCKEEQAQDLGFPRCEARPLSLKVKLQVGRGITFK
jgi:hypothetical protein